MLPVSHQIPEQISIINHLISLVFNIMQNSSRNYVNVNQEQFFSKVTGLEISSTESVPGANLQSNCEPSFEILETSKES